MEILLALIPIAMIFGTALVAILVILDRWVRNG